MRVPTDIRAILFDKDGTLLDYDKTWSPINRSAAALAARDDPALAERLLARGGFDTASGRTRPDSLLAAASNRQIAEAWVAAGSPWDATDLRAALDDLFTRSASQAVPVTDLGFVMRRLTNRGLCLGIASSDSEAAIRAMLRAFDLDSFVDFAAGYDSGFGSKPEPGMLLGFASAIGVEPAQVAVVGDNLHDMAMARGGGAGLRIGVLTGTGTMEVLSAASDICLGSIAELETFLFPGSAD